ncbi:MAG: UDP-N-acetylmuramate--L-alanine ligase [Muribaculaceae bacterium]
MGEFKSIYFVGAGGIGMAALVRYYLSKGYKVAGYDRTKTTLTEQIAAEGAEISYNEAVSEIPEYCKDKATTLVVYTPAIPESHAGLQYFRKEGFEILKRSELLGLITRDSKGLCFSGTHGKTTTSSMAAHILHCSDIGCNAFLGGILRNYDSNLLLSNDSPYSVIEADEFDRSFHRLSPYIAVVTATDPDHLDIYGTEEAYLESFAHFTSLVRDEGALIIHTGLKLKPRASKGVKMYSYSRDAGDFHAENIRKSNGEIIFDFVHPQGVIKDILLGVPVDINIENAVAAMAVCSLVGVKDDVMRSSVASYLGAKRRFEFWVKESGANGKVMIDDYAHHPDELKASIASIKSLYPNRQLSVIFQPHLFTRTRDFAHEFADALSLADDVILLDIYPAREEPIPGVTSEIIFKDIKCPSKALCLKNDLIDTVKKHNFDILLTVGAGDISNYLQEISEIIKMIR